MIATIESTTELVELDGVACRVWRGKTERGTRCLFYVHRIAVSCDLPASDLEAELLLCDNPSTRKGKHDHELDVQA